MGRGGPKRVAQFIAFYEPLKYLDMGNIRFPEKYSNKFVRSLGENYNLDFVDCRCCSEYILVSSDDTPNNIIPDFSDENMLKVKVLLERNKYFKENPLLKKPVPWTKEDEVKAEDWLESAKQPLFVKNQEIYKDKLEAMRVIYDL